MFETATLAGGAPAKRVWTTCIGITGEALLVAFAMVAPMIWPQVLPKAQWVASLAPPSPPPPPPPAGGEAAVRPPEVVRRTFQFREDQLYAYRQMPAHPVILSEPSDAGREGPGVPGGSGTRTGAPTGILNDLMREAAPPPPRAPAATAAPRPVERPIPRMTLGGNVLMGRLIHRVEPVYPRIAIQARIAGEVQLEAVVGPDGRVRELQVKSGHPMLVRAAVEAVRQWVFQPTLLNGEPVEVSAPVTVTFRLAQ